MPAGVGAPPLNTTTAELVTMRQLKNMWVLVTRVMFQLRVVQKYLMTCHCCSNKSRCLAITDRILSSDVTKLKESLCLISSTAISSKAGEQNKHTGREKGF